jgi:gp32 DNA binding protein like
MSHEQEWKDMLDEMEHDKEANASNRKYWQPPSDKEGTFPIRILPPLKPKNEKKFYFAHKIHWVDRVPFECLEQTLVDKNGAEHKEEDCPICAYVKKLYRTSERGSDGWKLAGELRSKARYDYRVIVRSVQDQQTDETKPQFYETGQTIFDMLYHIMKETDFGIIVDLKNGRDFNLVKKGLKRQSRYDQSLPSPNITAIFADATKTKAALDNAMKMDYSSLIEFSASADMDKSLRAYIGGEELPVKKQVKDPTPDEEFLAANTTPEKESSKNDPQDDIDRILKDFEA